MLGVVQPLDQWHLRHEFRPMLPDTAKELHGVAFGDGLWTALGKAGTIWTTPDPISVPWTAQLSGTTEALASVAFGNGRFVAVGSNGTIVSSETGSDWIKRDSGVSVQMNRIVFSGLEFVTIGESGTILTSADGIGWTASNSPSTDALIAIGYGAGTFVLAEVSRIWISTNLISWTQAKPDPVFTTGIAFQNGTFVAVTRDSKIYTSTDGLAWVQRAREIQMSNPNLYDVAFVGNHFIAVGGTILLGETFRSLVLTSPDGQQWTQAETSGPSPLHSIAAGNGRFTAVGSGAFGPHQLPPTVLASTDALSWTVVSRAPKLASVLYANAQFIAVGDNGIILASRDGRAWERRSAPTTANLADIAYHRGVYVSVGAFGKILRSEDGAEWKLQSSPTRIHLTGITHGEGLFAAVAGEQLNAPDGTALGRRTIVTSPDGITWTDNPNIPYASPNLSSAPIPTPESSKQLAKLIAIVPRRPSPGPNSGGALFDVAFGNDRFIAVGGVAPRIQPNTQTIITSRDGISWSGSGTLYPPPLRGIAFGNGMFLSVAEDRVFKLTGGWTQIVPNLGGGYNKIGFGAGTFVILGEKGLVGSSEDGEKWIAHYTRSTDNLHGAAFGQRTCVVVGESGAILQSDPLQLSAEPPRLTHPVLRDGTFSVGVPTSEGHRYFLEFSEDLSKWNSFAPVEGTGGVQILSDPKPDSARQFYRVRME